MEEETIKEFLDLLKKRLYSEICIPTDKIDLIHTMTSATLAEVLYNRLKTKI